MLLPVNRSWPAGDILEFKMRVGILTTTIAITSAIVAIDAAQRQTKPAIRSTQDATCAADLGVGVESKRKFCDVVIAGTPGQSVLLRIPPHAGAATLLFDLHNRFAVPVIALSPGLAYTKHDVVVAVIRTTGEVIGRATAAKEYRGVQDLFDRISGGGRPGGVKATAPGAFESWRFTIPAGVPAIGIVGERLRVITAAADAVTDAPGRPIAIVSNVRAEYAPVR